MGAAGVRRFRLRVRLAWRSERKVQIHTEGPDRGNLTPKRQVAPAARAAFNREERLVEVIGA